MHTYSPSNLTKNLIALAILITASTAAYAQASITVHKQSADNSAGKLVAIDTSYMECTYEYAFRTDTNSTENYNKDLMSLHIGKKATNFQSILKTEMDSIKRSGNFDAIRRNYSKYAKAAQFSIIKNLAEKKLDYMNKIAYSYYKYEESVPVFGWKLAEDTTSILGYLCKKAECSFRGRKYTAWYSIDIPVSEGPWKFCGLPGLIMKISDMHNDYSFTIKGIKKSVRPIYKVKRQYIKTSFIKYRKVYKKFIADPVGFLTSGGDKIVMKNADGSNYNYKPEPLKYDLMER